MTDNAVRVSDPQRTDETNLDNNSAPSYRANMNGHAASQSDAASAQPRDQSPRAELKIDDFEVLGDPLAKKGNSTAPKPTPSPPADTAADQSRDSSDSNTSRTSTDSSASMHESKNRTVPKNVAPDVKLKRYFKTPEGTWHMLDLDTGRRGIDTPKKEMPDKDPEPKNSTLTMPRTTSGKFTTINSNHTLASSPDKSINRTPNSVHVTSHDALYFVHESDARATWIYSLSGPPTNQSANSVSKGALKIVMSVLARDHAEISDTNTARQTFTLQFRHPPSCHVLNRSTARHELEDNKPKIELELLIGFKSGDILLHDPIRKSFTKHFNKGKALSRGAVVKLCWHPEQPDLFLASFDDTVLYAQNNSAESARPASLGGNLFVIDRKRIEDDSVQLPIIADMQRFSIWRHQNANVNPVARWHVSSKPIKDFSFSSTGRYLATAGLDGFLRVFDFTAERMLVVYKAYYGGLTCVTWTPDDRYVLLGCEDDALYVCSFDAHDAARCSFVARGKAHHSWISKISCDTWHGKGEGHYRLVSVGQDCRLVLWDFALDALLLPKETRARRNSLRRSSIHLPRPSHLVDSDAPESADQGCAPVILCPDDLAALVPLVSYHSAHTAPYSEVVVTPHLLSVAAWGGQLTCFARPSAPDVVM